MAKKGILLMNVGTPEEPTIPSVREYLKEFLLDPDVIDIPYPLRHLLVRGIILRVRPRKIAPLYSKIWMDEGSPLRVFTQKMSDELFSELQEIDCEVGMRYGTPSIGQALEKLRGYGVDELLLAPLFPHYAQATTGSSMKEALRQLKKMSWEPEIFELDHFEEDSEFIEPLARSIEPHISDGRHLLFSYHGLPLSHIRRMDKSGSHCQKVDGCCQKRCEANSLCYAHQCTMTTLSVVERLNIIDSGWSMSYQSRIGPAKWLSPSTLSKVEELAKSGVKKLAIVSPSFLADGLETLEELEEEVGGHFITNGGEEVSVVKCLNDDSDWIKGLASLVKRSFSSAN